ncbi:MAG: hypothetical protein ABII76_27530 [Pseudomonadota bacterium]
MRIIIAIAVVLGIALPPAASSASHDPVAAVVAEALRHAELAAQVEAHGHAHDDGVGEEQDPDHSHGHNPGDHSHETPDVPPGDIVIMRSVVRDWTASRVFLYNPGENSQLDRPPRPISVA